MRVLVTGANGFVGKALCRALSKDGHFVNAAVRSRENASRVVKNTTYCAVGEIDQDTDWSRILSGIDSIVHLAARVHIMHDVSTDPMSVFRRVNLSGTERLARQAAAAGVKRLTFTSSIKVNGEESPVPYTEKSTPNPQDPYAISKWEAEQMLHQVTSETGIEVVILRPPLVYGPGVKANLLQLIKIVNRGIPLPLASVQNKRSMIYLENLIDAIMTCMTHPRASGQTFLVSDGEDVSTPELIQRLAAALDRPSRLLPVPPTLLRLAGKLIGKSAEVERLLGSLTVDTTEIRSELDWKPPYTMEQGLKETTDWFKNSFEF